jgi:hypothetical protein
MSDPTLNYTTHFETLVALVTHLAVVGGDEADAANAPKLAKRLRLNEQEVEYVLDNFHGLFRRSEMQYPTKNYGQQYKYTLQLRYARRKYVDGQVANVGEALSNEELFALLEFISNKVREEQENERQAKGNRVTMIGVWIAAALSLASIIVSLLK